MLLLPLLVDIAVLSAYTGICSCHLATLQLNASLL